MNKNLKIAIALVITLAAATIVGAAAVTKVSENKQKEQLELARLAAEAQAQAELDEYNNFIDENTAFYPESYLNNIDISGMTPAEVIYTFEEEFKKDGFVIHVADAGIDQTLSFGAINVDFNDFDRYIDSCYNKQTLSQEEYFGTAQKKEYHYNFLKDVDIEELLAEDLFSFLSDNVAKSTDAYVLVNPNSGKVTIEPEVYGNEISVETLRDKIVEAFNENRFEVTVSQDDYVMPQVLSTDQVLADRKAKLESIVDKTISIKLCGENTSLSGENLWKILDGSDNYVSEDALANYIASLKNTYDSCYFNRTFTTSYGDTITLNSGNYGWVIDKDKTLTILSNAIASANSAPSVEVAYSRYGQRPALHEMTDTYIEVSIENQHVWAYVNGECVLSDDVITGEVTTNNPETITNRGVFRLSYKQHTAVLRGADYEERVTYWMPFDGGIGFHDATWRSDEEFGGTTYIGNGSHGCVNMRLDSAGALFNIINEEIMIIVW